MATPEKVAALARMKLIATVLFVAVTVLFVVARLEGWPWVAAFAEAAMIGALADWFAVVALFRRPLGLPIPHTAILPRNKARLADNLAIFIRDRFLDTQSLVARLRAAQPADRIAAWLQDEKNARLLADRLAVLLAESLDFMDDKRVRKEGFAGMIVDVASKEYPKVVSMLGLVGINPAELGEKVSVGIVAGVNGLLDEVARDPQHPRRAAFNELLAGYIERLKHDEAFRLRIEQVKRDFLAHPGVAAYLHELWDELRDWLECGKGTYVRSLARDMGRPDSRVRRKIASAAAAIGVSMAGNPALRDSVNEHIEHTVESLAPELRDGLSRHIASTMRAWNDEDLVREIEHSVGRDLQFIRLNGTVVGGLIGVALYAVTHLIT